MSNYNEVMLGFLWLESVLSADSTLSGLAPGGVWRALAPSGTAVPFVVMVHQAGSDVVTMNGFRVMDELLYQVKVVGLGNSRSIATLAQAAAQIDKLLGGPPSLPASGAVVVNSVTAGQVLACYRQSPFQLDELVDGELWTDLGGLYRLQIEQIAT